MLDLVLAILTDCQQVYQQGGVPVPQAHIEMIARMLSDEPAANLPRLPAFVRWNFAEGRWPDPAHTMSLLNVVRGRHWDVEIVPRTLANPRERKAQGSVHSNGVCPECLNTGLVITNGKDVLDEAAEWGRCACQKKT